MSFLSADRICAGYGKKKIVQEISFDMDAGSLVGIIGANGSGKTTLLKALCGILPHKGACMLDHAALETMSSRQIASLVSYIPQRSGIHIDISALDVVLMGFNPRLGLLEHPTRQMRDEAVRALKEVGLAGCEETNYLHFSEGQKQLCILARTLVADSKLLLLDEPESALDFHFRHKLLLLLRRWVACKQRGVIVTLHDPSLALNCCDKLIVLDNSTVLGLLEPKKDPLSKMEKMLRRVYGPISLTHCCNRNGERQIVILREEEE